MENDETCRSLRHAYQLLGEAVDEMKTTVPGSLATEIIKLEKTQQLLKYVVFILDNPPEFEIPPPLASLAQKPHSGTVCKNAILEAKQALIDLGMRQEDVEHILFTILARGIQIHFPVTPE